MIYESTRLNEVVIFFQGLVLGRGDLDLKWYEWSDPVLKSIEWITSQNMDLLT